MTGPHTHPASGTLAYALEYMEGVMEAEHSDIQDQWKIICTALRSHAGASGPDSAPAEMADWIGEIIAANVYMDNDGVAGISTAAEAIAAALAPMPVEREALHPDTRNLVDKLSSALAAKLRRAEVKYKYSNGWLVDDWEAECRIHLQRHIEKGDPLDVVAYAAFIWARGWSTAGPDSEATFLPVCE